MPVADPQPGLGQAVRDLRKAQDLTQEQLANLAGVHITLVGRLETGAINPTWGTVRRVARGLGVSLATLAGLAEAKERSEN